ncbi:hypothetical protein F5Y12DRAFT_716292 [Xylaria sp. FL1777]|nr:hypothetical protein F5Y12DRAFT_716292 [Xylaria sp. FL1777]
MSPQPGGEYEKYLFMPSNSFYHSSNTLDSRSLNASSPRESQFPGNEELDIDDREYSTIVRRALISSESPSFVSLRRSSARFKSSSLQPIVTQHKPIVTQHTPAITLHKLIVAQHKPEISTIRAIRPMGISLEVLSAYLLIVATYKNMLHHFCSRFSIGNSVATSAQASPSSPSHSSQYFTLEQTTPLFTIEVAGFQVHHGILQTKLLLETVAHQLALMEQLLGVPESWRATDKPGYHGVGLFGDDKTRLFVDAIGLISLQRNVDVLGGQGGLPVVESLRDHIRSLHSFLD